MSLIRCRPWALSNFVNFTVNLGVYPSAPFLAYQSQLLLLLAPFPLISSPSAGTALLLLSLNFNGVSLRPSNVSNSFSFPYPQNVTATISTADISTAGTVQVTLSNPAPGGGASAPQSFVITQRPWYPNHAVRKPSQFPCGFFQQTLPLTALGLHRARVP